MHSRTIGLIAVVLGIILVALPPSSYGLSTVCGTNCSTQPTTVTSLEFGNLVMGSPNAPLQVVTAQSDVIVNYFLEQGSSIASAGLSYCLWSLYPTPGLPPAGTTCASANLPTTSVGLNQAGPGELTTAAPISITSLSVWIFTATINSNPGAVSTSLTGAVEYSPTITTAQVTVSVASNANGIGNALVQIFSGATVLASFDTNAQGSIQPPLNLPLGSYTWTATASGFQPTTGSFTLMSSGYALAITMSPNRGTTTTESTSNAGGSSTLSFSWVQGIGVVFILAGGFLFVKPEIGRRR